MLDTKYMKDETVVTRNYENAMIRLRYEKTLIFGLLGQYILQTGDSKPSKGLTVCRKEPNIPTGIKTLNLMLDPAKTSERNETVEAEKKDWNKKFGNLNFTQAYEKLFELLWYSRLPCFDVKNVTSKERDEMSVIKRCYWRSQLVDCASIFVTRSSDRGMCCAFNVGNANDIYKSTKYRIHEEKMQKKTLLESYPGLPHGLVKNNKLLMISNI